MVMVIVMARLWRVNHLNYLQVCMVCVILTDWQLFISLYICSLIWQQCEDRTACAPHDQSRSWIQDSRIQVMKYTVLSFLKAERRQDPQKESPTALLVLTMMRAARSGATAVSRRALRVAGTRGAVRAMST